MAAPLALAKAIALLDNASTLRGASAGGKEMSMAVTATSTDTRAALISAAEMLFATRGIEGVSLRQVNRTAGQANGGALHYHFGDRVGLLRAIIDKHRADTEARRHALLDQYEASWADDLRLLAGALILPLAAKLDDPDGGRHYLRINCEIFTRPDYDEIAPMLPPRDPRSSIRRWHELLDPMVTDEEKTLLHTRFPAIRFAFVELARRAASPPRRDDRLFTSHMIDLTTALLATPASAVTRQLMDQRSRTATRTKRIATRSAP
jgi:AcrR family transcriptional regulator